MSRFMHGSCVVTGKGVPGWSYPIIICHLGSCFCFIEPCGTYMDDFSATPSLNRRTLPYLKYETGCNPRPMKGSIFINRKMDTSSIGILVCHHTTIMNNTTKSSPRPQAPKRGYPWTPALPLSILSISHLLQIFSAPRGLVSGVKASPNDNNVDFCTIARCWRHVMTSPESLMPV